VVRKHPLRLAFRVRKGDCKGTVGPEASNLSEAEGVRLKLLKLLELTGNPKRIGWESTCQIG
jgi:hypothetical protein